MRLAERYLLRSGLVLLFALSAWGVFLSIALQIRPQVSKDRPSMICRYFDPRDSIHALLTQQYSSGDLGFYIELYCKKGDDPWLYVVLDIQDSYWKEGSRFIRKANRLELVKNDAVYGVIDLDAVSFVRFDHKQLVFEKIPGYPLNHHLLCCSKKPCEHSPKLNGPLKKSLIKGAVN